MQNPRIDPGLVPEFYKRYVARASAHNLMDYLKNSQKANDLFFQSIRAEQWDYAYLEGKWSVKEVLLHLMDSERIFTYRALRFLRGDQTPLQGFDQDAYVLASGAKARSINSLMNEYSAVRNATCSLYESLNEADFEKSGNANGNVLSVGIMLYILVGHELHHFEIIRDCYLR